MIGGGGFTQWSRAAHQEGNKCGVAFHGLRIPPPANTDTTAALECNVSRTCHDGATESSDYL